MLFDLGDLNALSPRDLLRVSDAFVSHAHMDHFSGFDRLLRICLGRDKRLRLYGPPGFIDKIEHKIAAYDWNLIHKNPSVFVIEAAELASDQTLSSAEFSTKNQFRRVVKEARRAEDGMVFDEGGYQVRALAVDHQIPCLAFRIDEPVHVNVWRNRLAEMHLGVGPWLREAKAAIIRGAPDDSEIEAAWLGNGEVQRAQPTIGSLRNKALSVSDGQRVAYVVDTVFTPKNAERIIAFVKGVDLLFIEAAFLSEDAERAADRFHLTAAQAGEIGRRAGVRKIIPFHFSPRYADEERRLREEVMEAFGGSLALLTATHNSRARS